MTEGPTLDNWLRELCEALDLPLELATHRDLILDVARDAAHGVARPAAPLTTFLVGYAAGQAGNAGEAVTQAAAVATSRALRTGD
jgi:hypothetical protein